MPGYSHCQNLTFVLAIAPAIRLRSIASVVGNSHLQFCGYIGVHRRETVRLPGATATAATVAPN